MSTWKLWTPQGGFPQVPLIRAACDWPGWFDWGCLWVLVASSFLLLIAARRGWWGRLACIAMALSLAVFFILDQHRLQPWAWQCFLLSVLLSLADDGVARRGWRWLVVGIYFWSAVSKIDYTFCHEQGPALLRGLKQAMGLRGMPNRLTEALDVAGSLGISLGELGVAAMLAWPRTRWFGLWVATIMHLTLLAALGPFGLNHSFGVLLWNIFFIVQNWLLFRDLKDSRLFAGGAVPANSGLWLREQAAWPSSSQNCVALGVIVVAMAWPVLEPFGYCDHWLAWAVYSARSESVVAYSEEGGTYRPSRQHLWSLRELKVPVYPQARFQIGVEVAGLDIAELKSARLIVRAAPNRWTGTSSHKLEPQELGRLTSAYLWNWRPRLRTFAVVEKNPTP